MSSVSTEQFYLINSTILLCPGHQVLPDSGKREGSEVPFFGNKIENAKIFLADMLLDVMGSKTDIQSFQRLQETGCGWKCLRIDHKKYFVPTKK